VAKPALSELDEQLQVGIEPSCVTGEVLSPREVRDFVRVIREDPQEVGGDLRGVKRAQAGLVCGASHYPLDSG
jgi:hypothetical protein